METMNILRRIADIFRAKYLFSNLESNDSSFCFEDTPFQEKQKSTKHGTRAWAFEVLEIEGEESTPDQIREAYLRLSKKYHPDKFINEPGKLKIANELMAQINNAYEVFQK